MVAYNFDARHVPAIESGAKTRTIRRLGGKRHARPGEPVSLYTGQRSPACRLIAVVVCVEALDVRLRVSDAGLDRVEVSGRALAPEEVEPFAQADGFASADDMAAFWRQTHGEAARDFYGVMIRWKAP